MTRDNRNHRSARRSTAPKFFEPLEGRQLMSGGELDPSFSGDGWTNVFIGPAPLTLVANDVAVQPDGKTVVVGTKAFGGESYFAVTRFNVNGAKDPTFGEVRSFNTVLTEVGGHHSQANAVAIQPDGKIVVVGTRHVDYHGEFAVVRYNPNGTLDKTFDGDGKKTIRVKDDSAAYDVAIQRDGKIVIVGSDYNGGMSLSGYNANSDFAAVRLNPNGSMDPTFGFLGKALVAMGESEEAKAVTIDYTGSAATNPNFGKIILAGYHHMYGRSNMALARLNSNGKRDGTFDRVPGLSDTGYNIDPFPGRKHTAINAVLMQPDGKIVVAGYAADDSKGSNQFALSRYDANGKRDKSFGPNGNGVVETGFGGLDVAYGLVQMPDGGLVAGGSVNGQFAMAAYDANGLANAAFGTGGKAKLVLGKGAGRIAIGPNGTLMLAGGDNFTTARVLGPRPNVQIDAVRSTSEGAGENGSVKVTREGPTSSPLRVYLDVGGAAKLNQDYTSNLTVRQPAKGKTTTGTKIATRVGGVVNMVGGGFASVTGGVVMNVIGGAGGKVIGGGVKDVVSGGGLHEIVSNRSLPFIDIPAGHATATVSLSAIQDGLLEPSEAATFTLAADADYSIGERKQATVSIADDDELHVNFQTFNRFPPTGYAGDLGDVFGDRGAGMRFGWDASNTANARSRNSAGSPDARYDTYNHMQKNGANRTWEIALPNGMYTVRLVAGDADATDSVHRMNLEGQLALAGTPSGDVRWFRSTVNVLVSDGRLTLTNAPGAMNNKIAFIDIKAAPNGSAAAAPDTRNLPARRYGPATVNIWKPQPNGLFSDNQVDESMWA